MLYKNLVQHNLSFNGNIRILFANEEKYASAIIQVLKHTQAEVYIYDVEDVSELIRSYDLDSSLIKRIHFKIYDNHETLNYNIIKDITNDPTSILIKGNISATQFKKMIVNIFKNSFENYNHIACFSLNQYHKTLILSDVVYQRFPEYQTKLNIIQNLISFAHKMKYEKFNVGILSSVNTPLIKIASSIDAIKIKEHFDNYKTDFLNVDGPITLDCAIDKKSAIQKGFTSEISGDVDAILVPDIDVGNALYKSLTFLGEARVASILIGGNIPITFTSRSDSLTTILDSIYLAINLSYKD